MPTNLKLAAFGFVLLLAAASSASADTDDYNKFLYERKEIEMEGQTYPVLFNRFTHQLAFVYVDGRYATEAMLEKDPGILTRARSKKTGVVLPAIEIDTQKFSFWGWATMLPLAAVMLGVTLWLAYRYRHLLTETHQSRESSRKFHQMIEKKQKEGADITIAVNPATGERFAFDDALGWQTLWNGQQVLRYPSGLPKLVRSFKKGKLHGLQKTFYEEGMLQGEVPYEKGQVTGELRQYDRQGRLELRCEYRHGKRHGWSYLYGADGKVRSQEKYLDGQRVS